MKLFNDIKGQSTAYGWIFALVTLFGLGVLYIVFNQVFRVYLAPVIIGQINTSTTIGEDTKLLAIGNINQYLDFWDFVPFILFFVVVVFMFILAIRREGESGYI